MITYARLGFWLLSCLLGSIVIYDQTTSYWHYLLLYLWSFSLFVIVDYFAEKWFPNPPHGFHKPRLVIGSYIGLSALLFILIREIL